MEILTVNGHDTVGCKVIKERWANAADVAMAAREVIGDFTQANTDAGIEVIETLDSTVAIDDNIGVLTSSLLLSMVLVMLFLFLTHRGKKMTFAGIALGLMPSSSSLSRGKWRVLLLWERLRFLSLLTCRAALLTVSGIVFSFLGALLIFYLLEYSLNEISLLGFVLVSGIVVDDAIVVLENIQRRREQGEPIHQAVVNGTAEVFWPVVAASLTTIAAFLPMLLMTGSVGDFFALTPQVAIALAISLIECLFILPLHVLELEKVWGLNNTRHNTTTTTAIRSIGPDGMAPWRGL